MMKRILQVYIFCCGENKNRKLANLHRRFDACFCQNENNAMTAFKQTMGRMPTEDELRSSEAKELLAEITTFPEKTEQVMIVTSVDMACKLAGCALETSLETVPLSIEPFHYAHFQWGNKRCPGKWFMQRWNTICFPED